MAGLERLAEGQYSLDWHGPASRIFTRFRDEDLDTPVIRQLESVTRRYGNHIAVADSDTSLTFAELWDGISGLAESIAERTNPGDLVCIILPACSMFPVAILACLAAGRPFVALDPHNPVHWLNQVLHDARPALIIGQEADVRGIDCGARVIHLADLPPAARKGYRHADFSVDEAACVVFTSGSTGRPKGIVNSQRNILQRAAQSINSAHINSEDKFLTLASPSSIVGVRDILTALVAGASVYMLDPQRAGAREILNVIRTEGITILFAFPALMRSVIAHCDAPAGDVLRLVRIGGDTTLWSDIDRLRAWLGPEAAIQLIYAATEAPMMQWFVHDFCRGEDARIPIGYPLPGNRLALIDEQGCNTPPGAVGELVVVSPYVALGLWVDGRCVSSAVEGDGRPACRRFRTGDLARQRPDGLLERMGRKDRQVKVRGARVDLDGVEAMLRRHALVRDAAVLARPSAGSVEGDVNLIAYVNPRDEAPAGLLDDLRQSMRSAPAAMQPARYYVVPQIPRLRNSKLDVRALAAQDEGNVQAERARLTAASGARLAGGDHIARTVAQVWEKALQTPVGGPDDDFFDAGGDSLKAITFMLELERALGLELSITLISEGPSFGSLCDALRERRPARYTPLVPLKPGDGSPPVFIIPGLGCTVAGLFPMTRRIVYPGPVIGIQARGLGGQDRPHLTVEAIAAEYLAEVKTRQPAGPYFLCGYSFGGLVAFEMARRLRESGDEVALVGLFDTMRSPFRWPLRSWLSMLRGRVVKFGGAAHAAPMRTWPGTIRKMSRHAGEALHAFWKSASSGVLKVAASEMIASARYRPGYYAGELTLFIPMDREPGLPCPQATWREHAAASCAVETAGAHSTMFSAVNAGSVAAALTRCLQACSHEARIQEPEPR